MTREEKQLLFKDLCARFPYQPICEFTDTEDDFCTATAPLGYSLRDFIAGKVLIKPYLRPLSSMTEEEVFEFIQISDSVLWIGEKKSTCILSLEQMDWLNAHHFDYRGLIGKGLALEAPEGMYSKEEPEKGSEIPIPKTVDEAVKTLAKILSKEDRDYLLENGAISMHDSLGRWIRNEWGLWAGSELKDELMNMNKGLNHPDDMSNYIIEEFIKYCLEKI